MPQNKVSMRELLLAILVVACVCALAVDHSRIHDAVLRIKEIENTLDASMPISIARVRSEFEQIFQPFRSIDVYSVRYNRYQDVYIVRFGFMHHGDTEATVYNVELKNDGIGGYQASFIDQELVAGLPESSAILPIEIVIKE